MNRIKNYKLLLAIVVVAVLFTACGGKENADMEGNNPAPLQQPAAAEPEKTEPEKTEPAEIVFYTNNGDSVESFDSRFGEALRKKFPNYTIDYIRAC